MKLDTIQVESVYTEVIKPSQNVKPCYKNPYKFCVLDQFFGLTYVPQVLFYNNNNNTTTTVIPLIKESLSKTLSMYYPLAGRLSKTDNQSTINCNDQGVSFLLAQTNCSLHDYLQHPSRVNLVNQFLSPVNTTLDAWELVLLAIQVTEFSCGGIAIGSQCLHKVFDGASWGNFLKTWAACVTARTHDIVIPNLEIATLVFPPCESAAALSASQRCGPALTVRPLHDDDTIGTCVGKVFAFSAESIRGLQDKCRSEERVVNPTRIEAISTFIWKHAITAAFQSTTTPLTSGRQSVLIHSINMRGRTNPTLPASSIGNLITHSIAYLEDPETKSSSTDLPTLVAKVRKSVSEAKDPEFLAKFQGDKGYEAIRLFREKLADVSSTSISTYKFTSWSGLDFFPDFGLGLPAWCGFMGGRLSASFRNLVVLIENPVHHQIEAWLILDEHEMNILQFDPHFLEFAFPI